MIDVDGVRLRDLSVGGWLGVGIVVLGIASVAQAVLYPVGDPLLHYVGGPLVALAGASIAYNNAVAEVESRCETCGVPVRVHSGHGGTDEAVIVRGSAAPRRATIGPISLVIKRTTREAVYCSGTCADDDEWIGFGTVEPDPLAVPEEVAAE